MPQVSIITPIYIDIPDKLTWLSEMLQSLQTQSLTDWECILIDDCSPLLLGEVKFQFQSDNRLRWLKSAQNNGPAMTRNSAVALANSEAILPVDADDILPNPQVLQQLYSTWLEDKIKTVYGNLQVLQSENGHWQKGKVVQLAEYSFENAMNLNGVMPVTVMHSQDAWHDAGGWKSALQYGREDVEYWVSMGKAGYCGRKINHTTLLYRRHEQSRDYRLKYVDNKVDDMNKIILDLHEDVYKGEYPMGCCGKGSTQVINQVNSQVNQMRITTLDSVRDEDKVWAEYTGKKEASFSIHSRSGTQISYTIQGPGHKFEVHRDDMMRFDHMNRGTDFKIGVAPPIISSPIQEIETSQFNGGEPELATLERLDLEPTFVESTPIEQQPTYQNGFTEINVLGLSENISGMLALENWTVEKLAEANPTDLIAYRGIGQTRANQIVDTAKQWLEK